jgi:hypothetical protein
VSARQVEAERFEGVPPQQFSDFVGIHTTSIPRSHGNGRGPACFGVRSGEAHDATLITTY